MGGTASPRSVVHEAPRLLNPGLVDASYLAPSSQRARTRALPVLADATLGRDRVPAIRRSQSPAHFQTQTQYCTFLLVCYYYVMYSSYNGTLPSRRAPPHLAIVDRGNRPNIIYLTVCTWNRQHHYRPRQLLGLPHAR
jgi:hypothetical protein